MNNIYNFYHSEWSDLCVIDEKKKIIKKYNNINEIGRFSIINNEIKIIWNDWKDIEDIFIKIDSNYYEKKFCEKYISNYKLFEINIYEKETKNIYYFNDKDYIIFQKGVISNIGSYEFKENNLLIIKWFNGNDDIYIKILDIYYSKKNLNLFLQKINLYENDYFEIFKSNINNNLIEFDNEKDKDLIEFDNIINENNDLIKIDDIKNRSDVENIKIEENDINYKLCTKNKKKYKLINDKYIYIHENLLNYKITNVIIDNNIINNNLLKLINNINDKFRNKNYLNKIRINNYINDSKYLQNELEYMLELKLPFSIDIKKKKRILSLVEWGYPPFGGGENWMLNFNKILYKNNYDNFLICFSDPFKNEYFDCIKKIDLKYVQIIQMPKDILLIIKIIKLINPDIINHQGVNREYFMKISNILEIPFLTGFCFWNNIIKFNMNDINVNMINNNNLTETDEFEIILDNSYNYVSSDFVNDIVDKIYNKKLEVIETISLKDEYYIENKNEEFKQEYVTLINCHYNKGGFLVENLCKILNSNIPLLFVYTENDPNIPFSKIEEWINERNKINNVNILINGKVDIKEIYKKTRILLVPSICDETFCRVAYEGMMNNIPIISRQNGNLKYLLKDYAIFLDTIDNNIWMNEIQSLYFDKTRLDSFKNKSNYILSQDIIEKKIINKIKSIKESKYKLKNNNIGMIVPWADQGLGIQARDYYISLKELGYNPHIFSFKPYHATHENILLQTNREEWNYKNIHYSSNYREDITYDEIFDFVYKYNIKTMIIIEASFLGIFKIALFLKLLKINIHLIVNIECIRLNELQYHNIFDKILTNNYDSNEIIKGIFPDKSYYLGFHLNYPYFQKLEKKEKRISDKIKFCCFGGLNSISRKNIDKIIKSFYSIYYDTNNEENKINEENYYKNNWILNVYIQGVEVPDIIKKYKCPNIIYNVNNLSYRTIIDKYYENDISIHLGSHEGLGLGFYESLYTGTPIITINWTPNNEIVYNNINGWIVDCEYAILNDNSEGIIHRGILDENILKNNIINILKDNENTLRIINNTISESKSLFKKNKEHFNKNIIDFLQ